MHNLKQTWKQLNKKTKYILIAILVSLSIGGMYSNDSEPISKPNPSNTETQVSKNTNTDETQTSPDPTLDTDTPTNTDTAETPVQETVVPEATDPNGYRVLEVDGGDLSSHREPNVKVDIGYGDRVYWAYTNEYGQLVKVTAETIRLQDDATEPVNSNGRYYPDEAKVPGVEQKDLDEGHVIADALGGVSNAYNITPQNSTLNRNGDQAYMEKVIRDAGGCTDFTAIITYPNTETQIPSHYDYTYTIHGNVIHDSFDNGNPDTVNQTATSAPQQESSTQGVTPNQPQLPSDTTVYYTPNGKSYHSTPNCSTLSRSKTILDGPLSTSGKTDACNRCVK